MNFGEKLKLIRNERNMSQNDLAEKANISRVSIGNYERGDRVPTSDVLLKLANALGVSTDKLLGNEYINEFEEWFNVFAHAGFFVAEDKNSNKVSVWIKPFNDEMLCLSTNLKDNEIETIKKPIEISFESKEDFIEYAKRIYDLFEKENIKLLQDTIYKSLLTKFILSLRNGNKNTNKKD